MPEKLSKSAHRSPVVWLTWRRTQPSTACSPASRKAAGWRSSKPRRKARSLAMSSYGLRATIRHEVNLRAAEQDALLESFTV